MSQPELVKLLVRSLESAGIPYMLTGSVVSSLQGEPRATHDVDVVVNIRPEDVHRLLPDINPSEFYFDRDAAESAVGQKRMFNVLHITSGGKIDLWPLTTEPFDQSRFARRRQQQLFGESIVVSRPEDTILAKLRWGKLAGGSEKQFIDALRIYEVQHGRLDLAYLEDWVARLDLIDPWRLLVALAEVVDA